MFEAIARNQYKREIGCGRGATREEAIAAARAAAARELRTANPNWKWRIARIEVNSV